MWQGCPTPPQTPLQGAGRNLVAAGRTRPGHEEVPLIP
uniref:Uncharacterized protein n=1 Tax=Candidatus Magnetobacterium casense TaxID=1455061 RepID=A0A088FCG6_9BACT|nr:hypothetical protein Mcas_0700 [Candidatus Magnetobacterium casensis]